MEFFRRLFRSLIGYDSRIYRFGAVALDFLSVATKENIRTWVTLQRLKSGNLASDSPLPVSFRNLRHPILLRPRTPDAETIIDNVVREEYGQFRPARQPAWMIDAGAYIGDTAAYFLSRFPELKVVALEPNPPSYEMASRNLRPYGERAVVLQKGLSAAENKLSFGGSGTRASVQDSGFEIECATLPGLLEQFSIRHLDILKMDIEGAEELVFSSNPESWLHRTALIIIEIHSARIEKLVCGALRQNGFVMRRFRSLCYCSREP